MAYWRFPCPHCGEKTVARTSDQVSRLSKETKCVCQNPDCGHTFVTVTQVVRTISPSACPHPDVSLPIRDKPIQRRKPAGPGYAAMNARMG